MRAWGGTVGKRCNRRDRAPVWGPRSERARGVGSPATPKGGRAHSCLTMQKARSQCQGRDEEGRPRGAAVGGTAEGHDEQAEQAGENQALEPRLPGSRTEGAQEDTGRERQRDDGQRGWRGLRQGPSQGRSRTQEPGTRCPYNPAMTRRALFPGTFDPMTLGHLDVLQRARAIFDEVVVAVAQHHSKQPLLSLQQRVEGVRSTVGALSGVEVTVLEGLLVEGARAAGASAIVRGVRTASDLEYERPMVLTNRTLAPDLETVFLLPGPEIAHVSSTLVRQLARLGADLEPFVTPPVAALLRSAASAERDSQT